MTQSDAGRRLPVEHPVAVLRGEHSLMNLVVDAVEAESRGLLSGSPVRSEFWRRVVEFLEHFVDRLHHEKEEELLLPEIERVGLESAVGSSLAFRAEHAEGRRSMRAMLDAFACRDHMRLANAALAFCRRERQHIAREEQQLLPVCLSGLPAESSARLAQSFAAHQDTVDPTILHRCRTIARHITQEEAFETFAR